VTQIPINYSVAPEDRPRINKQCMRLLDRLKRGPVTNVEGVVDLNILNLTARVSELRQAGYNVKAQRGAAGIWTYRLVQAAPVGV
jgi:hypothetical protein